MKSAPGRTFVVPPEWPAAYEPGLPERAEAIAEAIAYATDGADMPEIGELVFLANADNWQAAGGDPDAIAQRWALRHLLRT